MVAVKTNKKPRLEFPLISENMTLEKINSWLLSTKIKEPLLYSLGFTHNNCAGGCVRAGKKQWKLLYEKLPEIYAERERVEKEVRNYLDKDISFFKDETLEDFRVRIEKGELSSYYDNDVTETECIGICSLFA